MKITDSDCVITHKFAKSNSVKVRVISFPISKDENEILITKISFKS